MYITISNYLALVKDIIMLANINIKDISVL